MSETLDPIAFTKVKLPYGWLSNMAPYPVVYEGKDWRTTEALFQALRFDDEEIREAIRAEKSPMSAKMVSKTFADKRVITPHSLKDVALMKKVVLLKLEQHPNLRDELLATKPREIIEDCSNRPRPDMFWGAVKTPEGTWEGRNFLGRIWMGLRDLLETES